MPICTDQRVTDSVTRVIEQRVTNLVNKGGKKNEIVESIISNVAIGASENQFDNGTQASPHLGKVAVAFVSALINAMDNLPGITLTKSAKP